MFSGKVKKLAEMKCTKVDEGEGGYFLLFKSQESHYRTTNIIEEHEAPKEHEEADRKQGF